MPTFVPQGPYDSFLLFLAVVAIVAALATWAADKLERDDAHWARQNPTDDDVDFQEVPTEPRRFVVDAEANARELQDFADARDMERGTSDNVPVKL